MLEFYPGCYCDHQKYIHWYSKECICLQYEDKVDSKHIAFSPSLSFLSYHKRLKKKKSGNQLLHMCLFIVYSETEKTPQVQCMGSTEPTVRWTESKILLISFPPYTLSQSGGPQWLSTFPRISVVAVPVSGFPKSFIFSQKCWKKYQQY